MAERARVVDVGRGERELLGQVRHEADQAREERLHVLRERLRLGRLLVDVRNLDEAADEVRLVLELVDQPDAADALDEDAQRPVGHAEHLLDDRGGADLVQVVPAGLLDLCVLRGDEREQPVARDDVVHEPDRALLPDRERQHRVGEDDRVLERQDRELRRELDVLDVDLVVEQLAHRLLLMLTGISMRSALAGFFASGSTIVSTPRLYVAFDDSTSTSAPSTTWRVKRP